MNKKDVISYVLVALISLVIGMIAFNFQQPDAPTPTAPKHVMNQNPVGSIIPDIALTTALQESAQLYDYKSDYVLINFWATWCPPCRREIPILQKLDAEHDNLQVLGFSYDVDYAILEYQQKMQIEYPLFLSSPQTTQLNALFGNKTGGLPYTVLLDKNHKIIMVHAGEVTEQQILTHLK